MFCRHILYTNVFNIKCQTRVNISNVLMCIPLIVIYASQRMEAQKLRFLIETLIFIQWNYKNITAIIHIFDGKFNVLFLLLTQLHHSYRHYTFALPSLIDHFTQVHIILTNNNKCFRDCSLHLLFLYRLEELEEYF